MTVENGVLERLILGEIEGKNGAIHAYDGMVWRIRSGFLTLLFGGWAIVLKGIVESADKQPGEYQPLAWGLFLFSLGFALGARYVDRNCVRRKFRVIAALGIKRGRSRIVDSAGKDQRKSTVLTAMNINSGSGHSLEEI